MRGPLLGCQHPRIIYLNPHCSWTCQAEYRTSSNPESSITPACMTGTFSLQHLKRSVHLRLFLASTNPSSTFSPVTSIITRLKTALADFVVRVTIPSEALKPWQAKNALHCAASTPGVGPLQGTSSSFLQGQWTHTQARFNNKETGKILDLHSKILPLWQNFTV